MAQAQLKVEKSVILTLSLKEAACLNAILGSLSVRYMRKNRSDVNENINKDIYEQVAKIFNYDYIDAVDKTIPIDINMDKLDSWIVLFGDN